MNVTIHDLMVKSVVVASPDETVEQVRHRMWGNNIHALPVVNESGEAVGILTASDLVLERPGETPVSQIMTTPVYTVPQYNGAHIAARIMRNHRLHHVVVTHEKEVVGIISSFDLLKLVEEHRFVLKNPPTESTRNGSQRQ